MSRPSSHPRQHAPPWRWTLGLVALLLVLCPLAQAQTDVLDPEAATEAYLSRLSPEEKARSDAYYEGGYWVQLWGFLYTLGMGWLFLHTRLTARMRDLAEAITRRPPLQTALFSAAYVVLVALLFFPLTLYRSYFREHQYDLATQSLGGWLRDQFVALVVNVILLTLLLTVLYAVFRRFPRNWWLWGSAVAVLFLVILMVILPVFILPLFNTYTPLEDEAIREPILAMARAHGIPVDKVYQVDTSRQNTRISANVSGFLGTMRISLNDNLLGRCSPEEIQAVMAHEMAHFVLHHAHERAAFFGLLLFVGFAFVRWSFQQVLWRWGGGWKVRGIGDVAGLPLLMVLFATYLFLATPLVNTFVRTNETEADLFGLNASREPDASAEVALKLSEYRKLDPGPVEEWIFFDHPSGRRRISMAMRWKASQGEAAGGGSAE